MINPLPWLPYLATGYLESILAPDMTVFEWGSGGSTLFLAERVSHLVSIEHNADWYKSVSEAIGQCGFSNVDYRLIEPDRTNEPVTGDKADPDAYLSNPFAWCFRDYVTVIEDYGVFDIILVDGRSRPSCLKHARGRVKPGGYVILDNAERDYYLEKTASYFDGWDKATFEGHGPQVTWFWETIFWRRPVDD